jgi:hypothetical protein
MVHAAARATQKLVVLSLVNPATAPNVESTDPSPTVGRRPGVLERTVLARATPSHTESARHDVTTATNVTVPAPNDALDRVAPVVTGDPPGDRRRATLDHPVVPTARARRAKALAPKTRHFLAPRERMNIERDCRSAPGQRVPKAATTRRRVVADQVFRPEIDHPVERASSAGPVS